ncbi:MAG TPA: superoxide dismutase family protein [Candidatus Limnocylindria bacterium]|nr:superoxide dismutase family protein [Candidatus Limnocylindria bacterium]
MKVFALTAVVAVAAVVVGACAATPDNGRVPGSPPADTFRDAPSAIVAQAALLDATGGPIGLATFTEQRQNLRIDLRITKLTPGKHGVHIHEAGKCDGPDFMTAGGHFNPLAKVHGVLSEKGPHAGDLPNIEIGQDGHGTLTAFTSLLNLAPGSVFSLLGTGGRAIVVHKDQDDEKTDPTGNSGGRVACGIIKKV